MSHELAELPINPVNTQHDEEQTEHLIPALPPVDRGNGAWKCLLGAFLVEAVLWGFAVSYGVFQNYYSHRPEFRDNPNIDIIGTLSTSLTLLGAPFTTPIVIKYRAWQRTMFRTGCAVSILALLGASFATTASQLILTQGFLYGSGVLILYTPLLMMMNEWFVARRGLAYGILYAGGGFAGCGMPFLMQWLLATYGHQIALRSIAIAQAVAVIPICFLVKERVPSRTHGIGKLQQIDFGFVRSPHFWVLTASNILQAFAYFIPFIYLPGYATSMGLSPRAGALLLAALNVSTTVGQVGFGFLTTRVKNVFILVFVTMFVSSVACFAVWGFGQSLGPLLAFAILFGVFGGAYVVFWTEFSFLAEEPQVVYGLMAFGKGVGSITATPIAKSLMNRPISVGGFGLGRYQPVIVYMSSLLMASSLAVLGWPLWGGRIQKIRRN